MRNLQRCFYLPTVQCVLVYIRTGTGEEAKNWLFILLPLLASIVGLAILVWQILA
jgi:hypothetical protein